MNKGKNNFICDIGECTGCHACFGACPEQCISMKPDPEGFLQPEIDLDRCIGCGKCRAVCPVLKQYDGNETLAAFAAVNDDDNIRMKSSSGGIFTLLAENIINRGGVVFGAAFDDDLNVKHIMIDSVNDIYKLRGSKYVQSRIGDAYLTAKAMLADGRLVLFSGTPCQIGGLKSFLGKEYENLITQDIICHGVPSPSVWQKYLEYRQAEQNAKINKTILPEFRNKSTGWHRYSIKLSFCGGSEYMQTIDKDLFMRAFLQNLSLRRSCYQCHFKSLKREGDLTLADFWGVERQVPELFDNKGTSLVLINSEKGAGLFDSVNAKRVETDAVRAVCPNEAAYRSVDKPEKREYFFNSLCTENFGKAVKKYAKISIKKSVYNKIRSSGGRILRAMKLR